MPDRELTIGSDPRAAQTLRVGLERARAAGLSFDDAWRAAVPVAMSFAGSRIDAEAWAIAFRSTRDAWRRSYLGQAARKRERVRRLEDAAV